MKTRAAVLTEIGKPFEIVELDLDEPTTGEVLIRFVAAGLCHSDLHLSDGDLPPRFPIVGGHEGAGIIERVGPGVTSRATTWCAASSPTAATAATAPPAARTCATWVPRSWRGARPTARSASTRTAPTTEPCACWARSPSTA
ncbi:alcohol dehydrogenase catalytic domain-containing protein [Streptomyces sp. SKN60]|nr:alcohol dehydrogenase catalytic domain-containing protein [Streptomyces sp. SKN60]